MMSFTVPALSPARHSWHLAGRTQSQPPATNRGDSRMSAVQRQGIYGTNVLQKKGRGGNTIKKRIGRVLKIHFPCRTRLPSPRPILPHRHQGLQGSESSRTTPSKSSPHSQGLPGERKWSVYGKPQFSVPKELLWSIQVKAETQSSLFDLTLEGTCLGMFRNLSCNDPLPW